jgi:hypothetical protein
MLEAYTQSVPKQLKAGEWHLPLGDRYLDGVSQDDLLRVVTARAARTSYGNFYGDISVKDDKRLHDQLIVSGHASPTEHALRAEDDDEYRGNVRGYTQYRKLIPNENRSDFDPVQLLKEKPAWLSNVK